MQVKTVTELDYLTTLLQICNVTFVACTNDKMCSLRHYFTLAPVT